MGEIYQNWCKEKNGAVANSNQQNRMQLTLNKGGWLVAMGNFPLSFTPF